MIEIGLIGNMTVRVDGQLATGMNGKQRQVLAILALQADAPVSKEQLADRLWQGSPPGSYSGSLDSYVCVLRRHLRLPAGRTSRLATTQAGFMLSTGEDLVVDLSQFRQLARSAQDASSAEVVTVAQQALDLGPGELLADMPYADWALEARDAFRHEAVDLAVQGAQRANALGKHGLAERLAVSATQRESLREDAWRQLMLARWFSGRRGSALGAYGEMRDALATCVGVEPGQESQDLFLTILRDLPRAGTFLADDQGTELRILLRLLRQTLDSRPGLRAPARDAALSEVAVQALAAAV